MSKISNKHIKLEEAKPRKEGFNWTGTLEVHCIISGFLAIVSVILFASVSITTVLSDSFGYYYQEILVEVILAISFILFIISAELCISAISFNVFNLSVDIKESLKKVYEDDRFDWEDFVKKQLAICKKKKR